MANSNEPEQTCLDVETLSQRRSSLDASLNVWQVGSNVRLFVWKVWYLLRHRLLRLVETTLDRLHDTLLEISMFAGTG